MSEKRDKEWEEYLADPVCLEIGYNHAHKVEQQEAQKRLSLCFNLLSDVQELIAMGATEKANELCNNIKRTIKGKYEADRFMIRFNVSISFDASSFVNTAILANILA